MPIRARIVSLVAALCTLLAFPGTADAKGLSSSESSLLREMNRVRVAHGLPALSYDRKLARAARAHTREMTDAGVFAHGAFTIRMRRFHLRGILLGENLAWGNGVKGSARGIVAAWLASPGHRANLLSPSFARVGLGEMQIRFHGNDGARIVTADFSSAS
jgi:uncharacterized protein YkwD